MTAVHVRPLAFACLLAATTLLAGCHPAVTVHPPTAEPASASREAVEAELTRHLVLADGVEVHATLWDAALLAATDAQRPTAAEAATDERDRWRATYLERTSFTVAFDIAERPPTPRRGDDPWTAFEHWSFALQRGRGAALAPVEVELLGIDRFPTTRGGAHYRFVARVHFDGPLHAQLAGPEPTDLKLWIRHSARFDGRLAMGRPMARTGAALRWQVVADRTPTPASRT